MSFTEDELQAFNSILEQRFAMHRQEMEHSLDQQLKNFRQDVNQQLIALSQDMVKKLKQELAEEEKQWEVSLATRFDTQQIQIAQTLNQDADQKRQHIEATIEQGLAAQLGSIEQALKQRVSLGAQDIEVLIQSMRSQLEAIELQTELPWEDLAEAIGKALDSRLASLDALIQRSVTNMEQYLALRLQGLQNELMSNRDREQGNSALVSGMPSVSDILEGIARLERIVESMQVAMSTNHALLSNRLYHHQQLPLKRAHPVDFSPSVPSSENGLLLFETNQHFASSQEPPAPDPSSEAGQAGEH